MPKKFLITGWSWFIWRALIAEIFHKFPDSEIWNLGRTSVAGTNFVDIENVVLEDLPAFDEIIHTLALSSPQYCKDFHLSDEINVWLTKRLAYAASKWLAKRFVHFSSVVVYSNRNIPPISENGELDYFHNSYSFTKGMAEEYLNFFASKWLPVVILRLPNVYWPGQKIENSPFFIPEKISQAILEWKVVVRSWFSRRDWLFLDDAVQWIISVLCKSNLTGLFNLWSGIWTSTADIGKKIANLLDVPYSDLMEVASWPTDFYSDISSITSSTWWVPRTSLDKWLHETIAYIKSFYENRHSGASAHD